MGGTEGVCESRADNLKTFLTTGYDSPHPLRLDGSYFLIASILKYLYTIRR